MTPMSVATHDHVGSLFGASKPQAEQRPFLRYMSFVTKRWWKGSATTGRERARDLAADRAEILTEAVPIGGRDAAASTGLGEGALTRGRVARRVAAVDGRQAATDGDAAPRNLAHGGILRRRDRVKEAVAERRRQRREVFIPLTVSSGGSRRSRLLRSSGGRRGERWKAWLFLLRLMYSSRDFGWIDARQDQVRSSTVTSAPSAHFGGVPARTFGRRGSGAGPSGVSRISRELKVMSLRFRAESLRCRDCRAAPGARARCRR